MTPERDGNWLRYTRVTRKQGQKWTFSIGGMLFNANQYELKAGRWVKFTPGQTRNVLEKLGQ